MNLTDIAKERLFNHQIAGKKLHTPQEVVAWMGAIQAQDYAMAKWAVGVRLPNANERDIEDAINAGKILRTHLLRPTWHLVSANDLRWMLTLTAPHIKATMKSRHRDLGLTEDLLAKCDRLIEQALRGGQHQTREEIVSRLQADGIPTDDNRAYHMLLCAELDGLVCSGVVRDGKQTYALLEERLPQAAPLAREAALVALAKRYFAAHAPATIQDFIWWSGLPVRDARFALDMAQSELASETAAAQTNRFAQADRFVPSFSLPQAVAETAYLLPAFDEFLIGYTDRSASLAYHHHNKAVSSNGIFRPVVVLNGQVIGIWKRVIKKDKVVVHVILFRPVELTSQKLIEDAAAQYGLFIEKPVELSIGDEI